MTAERVAPTRLVLIGHPVSHSLSPIFQNAALRAAGLSIEYVTRDVSPEELGSVALELRASGTAGNVTVPHKERMALLCDRLTPVARSVQAVNAYWVERDAGHHVLVGDNTDVHGAAAAIEQLMEGPPRGAEVLLLGAGGAAAAVLAALARWPGNTVRVRNRDRARAERLVARFGSSVRCSDDDADVERAHIVINATSLGLHAGDPLPCDPARLREGARVLDLVYRRGHGGTDWVQAVRARGLSAADGTVMLVEQGAAAFERWLGITPDRAVMWKSLAD